MVNQERVAAEWKVRGFTCDLWTDAPGQVWEDFVHQTDELVMVVEGRIEFEVEGSIFHPDPGDELFIPAGANHSVRNQGGTTARWLYGYKA